MLHLQRLLPRRVDCGRGKAYHFVYRSIEGNQDGKGIAFTRWHNTRPHGMDFPAGFALCFIVVLLRYHLRGGKEVVCGCFGVASSSYDGTRLRGRNGAVLHRLMDTVALPRMLRQ